GGRLTFPARDAEGRLVGLGRYLFGRERGTSPKLVSIPGSSRDLFPRPEAVDEGASYLFLVEGEPDAISAHSLGIPAVALPGAKSWQTSWRERFGGRRVCIVFDADSAGR